MKDAVINHAQHMMAQLDDYQRAISGAQGVTLRIISSLKAIALNADLLALTLPAPACSLGAAREDYAVTASQVQTLALMALANAAGAAAMIQETIPRVQKGAAKIEQLLAQLTEENGTPGQNGDLPGLALAEIDWVVRQLAEDANKSVAAVKELMPQVKRLRQRVLILAPGVSRDACICPENLEGRGPVAPFPLLMEPC